MRVPDKTEARLRAGMQVRYEVISTIYRNPPIPIKLPSASQFAAKYSISLRTVMFELKRLRDEGWITGQQGVGTFTNPARDRAQSNLRDFKIIGILNRDAKATFCDYNHWAFQMYTGLSIVPRVGFPRVVTLASQSMEGMYNELQMLSLDGIVWSYPPAEMMPYLQELQKQKIVIVSQFEKIPGIPYVGVDYIQNGRDIANVLIREKRQRILWCAFDKYVMKRIIGSDEVFVANGLAADASLICEDMVAVERKLTEMLQTQSIPDAIYIHGDELFEIKALFEKYGRDIFTDDNCRMIASWSVVHDIPEFQGIIRRYPYEEIGKATARVLRQAFDSSAVPKDEIFNMEVKLITRN